MTGKGALDKNVNHSYHKRQFIVQVNPDSSHAMLSHKNVFYACVAV